MLFLSNLRPLRLSVGASRNHIAALTRIKPARLAQIELRQAEPWFDEAIAIARTMNVSVHDLFAPEDMKAFDADPRFNVVDLKFWSDGVRLPLPFAMRLQIIFGLPTLEDLIPSPLTRQLWAVLEATERHPEAAGWCAWCQADIFGGEPHTDHCLPHNLLGRRAVRDGRVDAGTADAPLPARKGARARSAKVPGLKALRERLYLTQAGMAERVGFNINHYARIERGELPLVLTKADYICQLFNVSRDSLFAAPDVEPDLVA